MKATPTWLAGIWVLYFLSSVTYLLTQMLSG